MGGILGYWLRGMLGQGSQVPQASLPIIRACILGLPVMWAAPKDVTV